jgi:hypothetical protein
VPSGLETCSSSPCAGEGPCNEEPICEPAPSANFCFPRQAACSTDDDCGEAEICYDVGELTDELPEWWDQDQGFEYCLPKGWGLAFDERVEIVADDLEGDSGVSRGESGTGTALDDADETDDEAKNTASGTGGGGGGGGCALAWTAAPGSAGALGLVLLVTFARTRRFRSSLSAST